MATRSQSPPARFALRSVPARQLTDGVWWPQSRRLSDSLGQLFASWPPAEGRIVRLLYSPPDWDDRPRSVSIPGGRIKTGCFPRDDTHQLVLSMLDGTRRTITVIPPDTRADAAADLVDEALDGTGSVADVASPRSGPRGAAGTVGLPGRTAPPHGADETIDTIDSDTDHPVWDNEGGHP